MLSRDRRAPSRYPQKGEIKCTWGSDPSMFGRRRMCIQATAFYFVSRHSIGVAKGSFHTFMDNFPWGVGP